MAQSRLDKEKEAARGFRQQKGRHNRRSDEPVPPRGLRTETLSQRAQSALEGQGPVEIKGSRRP